MPELPEVETIRRGIEPRVVGAQITGISLVDPAIAAPNAPESLHAAIGATVRAVLRRGKYLILLLSSNSGLVLHLRMTGALFLCEPPAGVRVRAVLTFSNGERLSFADTRRLGKIQYYSDLKPLLQRMGQEPLDGDFSVESLHRMLSRHHIPIKAALLEQHIIAGIGNMYADEALFRSRVHPMKDASSLTHDEVARLQTAIRHVLEHAIARQGASVDTYWLPNGERGTAHQAFCVAHKKGAPCPSCGTPITRIMVRKRGAYFCPNCQATGPAGHEASDGG
ncbi:MAG: bifunctional DNA-formamidopyrimidine glycosylase/DNA-(apurinic or apyrimidinic site) lyase [Dehalococcoidia bacterium]|nr:bifunctional DNA-formamidopyrimidine glycosylase/DNA-(apurinic or apyrimidinic site) lyase [Dehalococcoidia bacterium]